MTEIDKLQIQIFKLNRELAIVRNALCTTIAWIGSSANSPLSVNDCKILIAMAERKE